MLHSVESDEGRSLRQGLDHNLIARHHVCIKALQGLTVGHHDIVGEVHKIINRTQTHGGQFVLQPIGAFLHFAVGDAHAGITAAGLCVLDDDVDGERVVIDGKRRCARAVEAGLIAVLQEPGIQLTGYTPVTQGISTVSRDVNLYEPVALQVVIFSGWSTHDSILWQNDDTSMRGAHTNLILCTNHSTGVYTAQLGLLDDKLLVAIIEHAAQVGHNDFLTSSNVGRSTDYL